ncbi:uncharacterized protein Dwil_GK13118 [Drosophila willistoni]|uniref:Uncharacterized protein n=1 Tax=Drosophila willistoni TaxID=7260 RepID=B4NGY3_DROWI|nr:uncharacterized protein Dwil_GK13118 [Drosophila willistoni]
MTPDRRMEMNHHRLTALGIENYLLDKTQRLPLSMPKSIDCLKNGSRDVSTNTDLQPLVVMGRFRQELQQSETLIYDNRCNAIIKPLKVRREVKSSAIFHNENVVPSAPFDFSESRSHIFKKSKTVIIQGVNRTKSTERLDKLHPQLWQRDATKNCLIPKSPSNARAIESSLPSSIASSSTNDLTKQEQEHEQDSIPVKKIMVKQCMTKEQPLRFRKPKPSASKNLILNSNSNSNSNSQRVAASPIQQNSHGPMNSVQRRLNYDPRASLRRNAPSKRMEESTENDAKAGPKLELSLPLNDIQADGVTDKILEMERQQRQRFQLLVAKQANEQKRLQDEFEMQQQALRDRILNDFNSLGMADEDMVEGEGGSENNH